MRLDVCEATRYTPAECEAIREYFAESGVSLGESESGNTSTIYDIAPSMGGGEIYQS